MEMNSAKELLDMTIQAKEKSSYESAMYDINSAVDSGGVASICNDLCPKLQEELLKKGYDVIRYFETNGKEICNLVYWGKGASGKFVDYTS